MIAAKNLTFGKKYGEMMEGGAIAIYDTNGNPIVLVIEIGPAMVQIYSVTKDAQVFTEMMKKYDPQLQLTVNKLEV